MKAKPLSKVTQLMEMFHELPALAQRKVAAKVERLYNEARAQQRSNATKPNRPLAYGGAK